MVTTVDGQALTGLLVSETAASITLRRQGQADETIMRTQIKQLRADGKSLMPDGLEVGLGKEDVADLIAFLREGSANRR